MESISTPAGVLTYFLYAIPIFVAIWIGLIQLQVQVKVQKDIFKAEKFSSIRLDLIEKLRLINDQIFNCYRHCISNNHHERDIFLEDVKKLEDLYFKLRNEFGINEIYVPNNERQVVRDEFIEFARNFNRLYKLYYAWSRDVGKTPSLEEVGDIYNLTSKNANRLIQNLASLGIQ
ncbi:hypothetical protein [Owenweeksia hongkongensis]|uniref:hypothetical protein n=1 Tax=Owenweeksia hongkongensis TaxID=253245 RepID=UPI003A93AA84